MTSVLILLHSAPASARSLPGTLIVNAAQVDAFRDDERLTVASNEVRTVVGEILDIALAGAGSAALRLNSGVGAQTAPVLLRNGGTGREAFVVEAGSDLVGVTILAIAIDRDGDGRFDPATDTVLDGGTTPLLDPGQTLRLLVRLDIAAESGELNLIVAARAVTGSGTPGTLFDGRGDDGSDALVGETHAAAELRLPAVLAGPGVALIKSQQVSGERPVPGAIVTYTLAVTLAPGATITKARLVDPVPDGVTYVTGSLRLDGAALSDDVDDDAGAIQNDTIQVALGGLSAAASRAVTFQARLN